MLNGCNFLILKVEETNVFFENFILEISKHDFFAAAAVPKLQYPVFRHKKISQISSFR